MLPGKELEGDGGCGEQGPGFPKQLWELLPGGKTPCQALRVDQGSAFVLCLSSSYSQAWEEQLISSVERWQLWST